MAKVKGRLKRLGLLLVLLLVVGFAWNGTGLAVAEDNALPDQIILSWTADPQTTQTVAWRVYSTVTSGKVQYMKEGVKTADFSGAQEKEAVCSELYEGYNHFEVEIDSLEPYTTYAYRVGTDGCWSGPASFTTAGSTDHFSFMYMGDIHIGYNEFSSSVWRQLLDQARTNYPELKFALQSGDLVDETENLEYWENFFSTAAGVFDFLPLMPALGNHEDLNPDMYFKSFALPPNGPEGLKEQHYSFDYGNAHFVVLDSNQMGSEGADYEAGIAWLENDLQYSSKEWKFVMFHHPPYGVDPRDEVKANMIKENWIPVMERNGVDIIFVGHQHMYMRTYPIYEGLIQEKPTEGITYVMGNAGNKVYLNPDEHGYIAKVFDGPDSTSYTAVDIDGDVLTMTTRGVDGTVKDEYKISKSNDMDSRVGVSGVKLLDSSFQEISSVTTQENCRLQVHLNNYTSKAQTAIAIIQLRSGNDAVVQCGGESLGIVSLQTDVPSAGADVYADFKLPDIPARSKVYVDVYVLDEANVPISAPYQQFSFSI